MGQRTSNTTAVIFSAFFPKPISDLKGAIPMEWIKIPTKERQEAVEEFRKLLIED